MFRSGSEVRNAQLYGSGNSVPDPVRLRSGPLEIIYENGNIRYISFNDTEILRMIYFAVRDHNWNTIDGVIFEEKISTYDDRFLIEFSTRHRSGEVDFLFKCRIEGTPDGHIDFNIDGIAESTFSRNRIGFCVLHPLKECKGKTCRIVHITGETGSYTFPEDISPDQPFKNIRSMQWKPETNIRAKVSFSGDVFETEDQRNWTDASYKTYCTPLDLPFPVRILKGTEVNQKVSLDVIIKPVTFGAGRKGDPAYRFSIIRDRQDSRLPQLGTSGTSVYDTLNGKDAIQLKNLKLSHIRYDLILSDPDLELKIQKIRQNQIITKIPCMLALFFTHSYLEDYDQFKKIIVGKRLNIQSVVLFSTTVKVTPAILINGLIPVLKRDFPDIKTGGGTDYYFAELNRSGIDPGNIDFISFSINPQVHAFDPWSMTETLAAQAETVRSARKFSSGKSIVVSPVTLKPRFNPDVTGPEPDSREGEPPSQVDSRQFSLFGACWTMASVKYLAEEGVPVITYFETTGWCGLIQGHDDPPMPEKINAEKGQVAPLYVVFLWLSRFRNARLVPSKSSNPLLFDGIIFKKSGDIHIFLVNFTADRVIVNRDYECGRILRLSLDLENVKQFMDNPDTLNRQPEESVDRIMLEPLSTNWFIVDDIPVVL